MNRYITWLFTCVLLACGQASHAELQLDSSMKPKLVEKLVTPLFKSVVHPYGEQHSADFGGPDGKQGIYEEENDKFAWLFNGKRLLSMIASFNPEIVPLEDCKPEPDIAFPNIHCEWRRVRSQVCHLFMFDGQSLKLENVTRLNIVRDKKMLGLPRCRNIQAMAVAKTIPDAMLITLEYSDSNEPADPRNDPPLFYSTVLLRFHDENGKLKIEQDDSCLGNPNKYKTIAAARKALMNCNTTKKQ